MERVALSRKADAAGDNDRQAWKAQKKVAELVWPTRRKGPDQQQEEWWLFDSSQSIHGLQTIVAAAIKKVHP